MNSHKAILVLGVVIVAVLAMGIVSYSPPVVIDKTVETVRIVKKYNESYSEGGLEVGIPLGDSLGIGIQSGRIGIKIGDSLVWTSQETKYRYYLEFDNGMKSSVNKETYDTYNKGDQLECLVTYYNNGNIKKVIQFNMGS